VPKFDMQEFEEQAQRLIGLALSKCEVEVANNCEPPPPQKAALCAAAVSLQEAFRAFITLAKSV